MQQQDIAVSRGGSKEHLRELFQTDRRGLILSMIHKFEGIDKNANLRDNIYVFIDEAHRSVAKNLGTYLMAAVLQCDDHRIHGDANSEDRIRGGYVQDIRSGRRVGLSRQIHHRRVYRRRNKRFRSATPWLLAR